uniref:Uncharacterized protein n=1 Tax=Ciona intestinalis TaxID=7719 RepID=F6YF21_CIOIN
METLSGSVAIQNRQEFVESDVFPTNIDLFGNCSVNYEFTSYFTLERDDLPRFMIQVKSGIDVAEQSGFVELAHSQISLTIDEVERSVNAEVNTRSLFSVTHSVPEVEPYIPRHLAISTGFTSTSGRVTVEYDVNRVRKSVNVGATLEDNHLRLQATQNVNTARNVPQHIVVQLAGSMENKNFTVLVSVDDTNFDTTGEIYTGAAEGWYGISL